MNIKIPIFYQPDTHLYIWRHVNVILQGKAFEYFVTFDLQLESVQESMQTQLDELKQRSVG